MSNDAHGTRPEERPAPTTAAAQYRPYKDAAGGTDGVEMPSWPSVDGAHRMPRRSQPRPTAPTISIIFDESSGDTGSKETASIAPLIGFWKRGRLTVLSLRRPGLECDGTPPGPATAALATDKANGRSTRMAPSGS